MSIKNRLAKLERSAPGGRGRFITVPLYEGETGREALALEAFPEPDQAEFMERLRADMFSLWPELGEWEADAEWNARRDIYGFMN